MRLALDWRNTRRTRLARQNRYARASRTRSVTPELSVGLARSFETAHSEITTRSNSAALSVNAARSYTSALSMTRGCALMLRYAARLVLGMRHSHCSTTRSLRTTLFESDGSLRHHGTLIYEGSLQPIGTLSVLGSLAWIGTIPKYGSLLFFVAIHPSGSLQDIGTLYCPRLARSTRSSPRQRLFTRPLRRAYEVNMLGLGQDVGLGRKLLIPHLVHDVVKVREEQFHRPPPCTCVDYEGR